MPAPSPRRDTSQVQFTRELQVAGAHYQATVTTSTELADTFHIEVWGAGPGGEATQLSGTVPAQALAHLGPLLDQVLGGLATAHGITVDRTLGAEQARPRRRGDRRPGAPRNAGQPWTSDQKTELARRWLDADPTATTPVQLIAAIADDLGRTGDAIRSQLQRQHLNPERPGSAYGGPGRP